MRQVKGEPQWWRVAVVGTVALSLASVLVAGRPAEASAPELNVGPSASDRGSEEATDVTDAVGAVLLASSPGPGRQGNGDAAGPAFSPDGQSLAFESEASNLVTGKRTGAGNVYVNSLLTGKVALVSKGVPDNHWARFPQFSPDGSSVVYTTNPSKGAETVIIEDLAKGTRIQIPDASGPSYSPDGLWLAYESQDNRSGETVALDIVIRNLRTGKVKRVSTSRQGARANAWSFDPVFSPDGKRIAFASVASNLVPGDTNGSTDVFVKNLRTGRVTRVSTSSQGAQGNDISHAHTFSPDGTRVAFESEASNLVVDDVNRDSDVFVKDLRTGEVALVSANAYGEQGGGSSRAPTFAPDDGMRVAFTSDAVNLVPEDTNDSGDIFVKDLRNGTVLRVSTTESGAQADDQSWGPVFSPDGARVAFSSYASNLVPGDTNGFEDVFVKVLPQKPAEAVTLNTMQDRSQPRTQVEATPSTASVEMGQRITIRGVITPGAASAPIVVQSRVGRTWRKIKTGVTEANGVFSLTVLPTSPGVYRWRVSAMRKGAIIGSSAPFTVTALRWYYLSEFPEVASTAVERGTVRMNGVTYVKSLIADRFSWSASPASSEYDLRRACTTLRTIAGMPDDADSRTRAYLNILADGATLFSQDFGLGQAADVDVSISEHLRLRMEWVRSDNRAYGAFGNARILCSFRL